MIMITKRKFGRLITKIERSIKAKEQYLPLKVCDELREYKLWFDWCREVNTISGLCYKNRRLALPKFIKRFRDELLL